MLAWPATRVSLAETVETVELAAFVKGHIASRPKVRIGQSCR